MSNEVIEMIIAILPSVIAVLATVGTIIKVLLEFKKLKAQVTDMKAIEDLRDQMKGVMQENYELKKTLKQTMTKIDHVRRD